MITACYVCDLDLDTEEAHTFHADDCPMVGDHDAFDDCIQANGCGEDCHPRCCPSCEGLEP